MFELLSRTESKADYYYLTCNEKSCFSKCAAVVRRWHGQHAVGANGTLSAVNPIRVVSPMLITTAYRLINRYGFNGCTLGTCPFSKYNWFSSETLKIGYRQTVYPVQIGVMISVTEINRNTMATR